MDNYICTRCGIGTNSEYVHRTHDCIVLAQSKSTTANCSDNAEVIMLTCEDCSDLELQISELEDTIASLESDLEDLELQISDKDVEIERLKTIIIEVKDLVREV